MSIPASVPIVDWAKLDATQKRARLLAAASEVFARDGLDAPMPAIAAAAGAGVGSVYRQFPSKHDLLAALVVKRLEETEEQTNVALERAEGPWLALTGLLWDLAERQAEDDVLGEAMVTVSSYPAVEDALASAMDALERLLAAARKEGRLRPDATTQDLRLLFAATRASARLDPHAWRRMLELALGGLARRSPED
jgi:AcrR family transcriptional regulator